MDCSDDVKQELLQDINQETSELCDFRVKVSFM